MRWIRPIVQPSSGPARLELLEQPCLWALLRDANPLASPPPSPASAAASVYWSGWLSDDPFARDPRTWGPAGLSGLCRWVDAAATPSTSSSPAATPPAILLRPHCRHVLSDVQRCLSFFRPSQAGPAGRVYGPPPAVGLVLDPVALLEPSMLPRAEDHLSRIILTLGPIADAIWLADASPAHESPDDIDPPLPERRPVGRGVLPTRLIWKLISELDRPDLPVILEPDAEATSDAELLARTLASLGTPH